MIAGIIWCNTCYMMYRVSQIKFNLLRFGNSWHFLAILGTLGTVGHSWALWALLGTRVAKPKKIIWKTRKRNPLLDMICVHMKTPRHQNLARFSQTIEKGESPAEQSAAGRELIVEPTLEEDPPPTWPVQLFREIIVTNLPYEDWNILCFKFKHKEIPLLAFLQIVVDICVCYLSNVREKHQNGQHLAGEGELWKDVQQPSWESKVRDFRCFQVVETL